MSNSRPSERRRRATSPVALDEVAGVAEPRVVDEEHPPVGLQRSTDELPERLEVPARHVRVPEAEEADVELARRLPREDVGEDVLGRTARPRAVQLEHLRQRRRRPSRDRRAGGGAASRSRFRRRARGRPRAGRTRRAPPRARARRRTSGLRSRGRARSRRGGTTSRRTRAPARGSTAAARPAPARPWPRPWRRRYPGCSRLQMFRESLAEVPAPLLGLGRLRESLTEIPPLSGVGAIKLSGDSPENGEEGTVRTTIPFLALLASALALVIAPNAAAAETQCVGFVTGTHDNVVVPPGQTCSSPTRPSSGTSRRCRTRGF